MSISFFGHPQDDLYLNVSNGNAFILLKLLGIEADYCGSVGTAELLDKVRAARSVMASRGSEFERRETVSVGRNGAVMIQCGLGSISINLYLDRLEELVSRAHESGMPFITWS